MARTNRKPTTPVSSLRHRDKRANIPTRELEDFVAADEAAPKSVSFPGLLYARDPSLDPQLVWKGKDDQDAKPLDVPAVPVYIQEKILPQAIIEQVRSSSPRPEPGEQLSLFADFNGLPFEDLVDFYAHEQNWANRLILGDSLLVMTSLAEKEGLKGQVQMIYLDPPYGIKFGSNWQVSTRKRDVKDGRAEDATRQPEQIKAFRDTWELGIHSYLSYLRDRLVVARELLTESGSIFVQIGDENVHLVRCLMDEVFGSENMIGIIMFQKSGAFTSGYLPTVGDYIIWYGKEREKLKYRPLFLLRGNNGSLPASYDYVENGGSPRRLLREERVDLRVLPAGSRLFQSVALTSSHEYSRGKGSFEFEGVEYLPGNRYWSTSPEGMWRLAAAGRLLATSGTLRYKMLLDDFAVVPLTNMWTDVMGAADIVYVVQTASRVIERCLLMTTDPGDLVLDPTCGSGTTAYVAEQWGRRWITIDTSRVALALARTRLMSARYPYYHLADNHPQITQMNADEGIKSHLRQSASSADSQASIRKGFVYRRVPHVTLKSIANNEEIDAICAKWQLQMEPLRAELNRLLGQSWEEWQLPRALDASLVGAQHAAPIPAAPLLAEWWRLRRERQAEIDASIARHADTELLYDQPYEGPKRIRVAGPFTVESLSPHRVLPAAVERPAAERAAQREPGAGDFVTTILDNLRKAGVQNTVRNERLKFDRLEPYAGEWLQAAGEYTESDGTPRRVAVCIGPEHGTVGPELIKEAAKEAVRGVGFDLLLVCGFAFDPHVSEEAKRYGKLAVLITRMNPDLAMGDELLKKTGAGNLFMVFGEPDLAVKSLPDGQLTVEIKGLDVYDPTTGQIRSSSTDDIACWFIDTDYNEESFFVRHAYFTGADEPYEKLKRALRAEINEAAWSALYSTVSQPFARPKSGKIAVKVINHYGDEVLKVYAV